MLIKSDIDSLLVSERTFQEFNDSTITLLGGTGFMGRWLIEALHTYGRNYGFFPEITVVTRNPKNAYKIFIEVGAAIAADSFNEICREDQRSFVLVTAGPGLTNVTTAVAPIPHRPL